MGFGKLKSWIETILLGFILLYSLLVFFASADNLNLTWRPSEMIAEFQYLKNSFNKKSPQTSSPSHALKKLVEEPYLPAVQLIQQDPEFKHLIDMMIKYKIPITSNAENLKVEDLTSCREACYLSSCPGIGKVYLTADFSKASTLGQAEIIVHELTHAENRIKNPSHYCHKKLVSDEFSAFKNEVTLQYKHRKLGLFDYFDKNNVLHEYCLYKNIKKTYPAWTDDMNLRPPNKIEQFWCLFTTWM